MEAHDNLFSHLKQNMHLPTNERYFSHIKLDEDWDETFWLNNHSLLIIGLRSHPN